MEKYWALDLTFHKLKGKFACRMGRSLLLHPKHKEFRVYKVHEYIKSKVINKIMLSDEYENNGDRYKHLVMKRRFIIPSEVTITKEYFVHKSGWFDFILFKETKMKSIMKYVVDESKLHLKPIEIIYYIYDLKQPFLSKFSDCFHTINEKTQITYDRSGNEFKYYRTVNGIEIYNLQGVEAKREIENFLMNNTFNVVPVENIETAFQTV